jgi:serine/threonine protein kinase
LETVCLKCLEKEPGRRYSTAKELADDLARFLAGGPIVAVPLATRERLARLAARDGYQIHEEIGRGPASIVYRALYGPLKQTVALKVFPAGSCTRGEWEDRLRRSAELWAAIAHPHVVPVQRAGWWESAWYVVVEFDPHGSLADNLTGRPYDIRVALRLVEQLAEVVSYLHRQGVVHGNLKPSNVLTGADGIPRLIDLHPTGGLFLGALAPQDVAADGLAYLAPELVRERGRTLRPNMDVYGLGLILYELLTGLPALAGASSQEVLEQVCSHEPTAPSHFNPHVVPSLDAVVLKCLRKNPWERYARVYDLSRRLRDFQENLGNRALPERRPTRRPPD